MLPGNSASARTKTIAHLERRDPTQSRRPARTPRQEPQARPCRLEFARLHPWAKGGEHSACNLTLRCRAHNALEADRDVDASFVASKRIVATAATGGGEV